VRAGERLPVNVACVLDGEEFVGSTHYHELVERYADRIPGPIGGVNPTCHQAPDGSYSLSLANKGCAYLDLRVRGSHWRKGPLGAHVHSSAQAVVHSPPWRLVEALAALVDAPGGTHVAIPGFYDAQPAPSSQARHVLEGLAAGVPRDAWNRRAPGVAGFGEVGALVDDLTGVELLERALYGTTFNIGGLRSGYTDIDSALFTLPGEATARVDIRYAPPEHGRRLVGLLRQHLDDQGFPEIEIVDLGTHDGSSVSHDDEIMRAAIAVARDHGHETTVWPMRAAGAPVGVISEVLGVPSLGGFGLGAAGTGAGADEFYVIEGDGKVAGFEGQARYYADYLVALDGGGS
jgi:acetylornithine deacetylase/succinyl-diaminopimelate desuccinylase-like protein